MPLQLKTLRLSWFRGAADELILDTKSKSVVIYGPNGAGKSSLVDALEYVLTSGKVGHLASEYSGRRLENAIPNTCTPPGIKSTACITLHDNKETFISVDTNTAPKCSGNHHVAAWSPTRSILRQDSVTGFVTSTKADKYRTLLPLLGFEPLEMAASNLRLIKLEVEKTSQIQYKEGELSSIIARKQAAFPNMNNAAIGLAIKKIFGEYLPDAEMPSKPQEAIALLKVELKKRLDGLDATNKIYALLCQIRDAGLKESLLTSVRLSREAAQVAQPVLSERLAILQAAKAYSAALAITDTHEAIDCPACGRPIPSDDFSEHVAEETIKLEGVLKCFTNMVAANKITISALIKVQTALKDNIMSDLWSSPAWTDIKALIDEIGVFDASQLENPSTPDSFVRVLIIADAIMPRIEAAASQTPATTQILIKHRDSIYSAGEWSNGKAIRSQIDNAKKLIQFLEDSENAVRQEIRNQSAAIIKTISNDVADMWSVLHPDDLIDEVGLYQHIDADKAIDLTLRFHGKVQPSPRLTLSEGYRNSLGLCVFLALAKRGLEPSPIVLDDVVTSFDREHRASVADLLIQKLDGLQLIVLTHEYDWFIDLSNRLPAKQWGFQQLRPFESPQIGIQWSNSPIGFAPARALLSIDASAAANKARGLLDQHLAVVSERLQISMPFIRGPRNELRHSADMLARFASKAALSFKKRTANGKHDSFNDGARIAIELKQLLVPFANPPSHGRLATKVEAEKIIESGEEFLSILICQDCSNSVTRAQVPGKHVECECGSLRWLI